jgi:hypothetical protein
LRTLPAHGLEVIDRSTVNAWDEPRVVRAIWPTGQNKVITAFGKPLADHSWS